MTKCSIGVKPDENNESNGEPPVSPSSTVPFYFEVIGEGNSKKVSKKNSAAEMLKVLKEKFEPLLFVSTTNEIKNIKKEVETNSSNQTDESKSVAAKKSRKNKAKNIVKEKKASPEYGKGSINPISRLIQIQQSNRQKEPLFEEVNETSSESSSRSGRHEFTIRVSLDNNGQSLVCNGKGCTKKLAKQNAAELMLAKMGYQAKAPLLSSLKSAIKSPGDISPYSPLTPLSNISNSDNQEFKNSTTEYSESASAISERSSTTLLSTLSASVYSNEEKSEKRVKFQEDVIAFESSKKCSIGNNYHSTYF